MLTLKEANEQLKLSLYTIEFDVDNSKPYVLVEEVEMGTMELDRFESIDLALKTGIKKYIADKERKKETLKNTILILQQQLQEINSYKFDYEID